MSHVLAYFLKITAVPFSRYFYPHHTEYYKFCLETRIYIKYFVKVVKFNRFNLHILIGL